MNKQVNEALVAIGIYVFLVCAFSLPFLIGYFTAAFQKRLDRLDEAMDIFFETKKYNNGQKEEGTD